MPILPVVSLFHIYLRSDFLSKSLFTDGLIAREVQFSLIQPVSLPPSPLACLKTLTVATFGTIGEKLCLISVYLGKYKNHTALRLSAYILSGEQRSSS